MVPRGPWVTFKEQEGEVGQGACCWHSVCPCLQQLLLNSGPTSVPTVPRWVRVVGEASAAALAHICLSCPFFCRSWRPCEIALPASETVASATSKESHDLYARRGARPLPGILRSPEEWTAGPPPHSPALPDPAPAAVRQPQPAPPRHHRLPPHAPLQLQDDR